MNRLINKYSSLFIENKVLVYNVLKSIYRFGIEIGGTVSNSNMKIIQPFPSMVLSSTIGAQKYVSVMMISHQDIHVPTIK